MWEYIVRNLIICCDGTGNEFGIENTNVIRVVQCLERDSRRQRLYYEPGVGTLPEPSLATRIGKKMNEATGLAFGAGLLWKVREAYAYLMEMWEPGDRVFLFGFSRGAYTARVLAGALHQLGLLPRANHHLLPYAMRLYDAVRVPDRDGQTADQGNARYRQLLEEFRWTFARLCGTGDARHFPIHFLGLWDTVSSVGYAWEPKSFRYTRTNPSVAIIRHAVSIDERRCFFRQNLFFPAPGQDLDEQWFPGVHSDVGGGYPEAEGGLWRPPFTWIVEEAIRFGLAIDAKRRDRVESRTPASASPWADKQHESLTAKWWPAEIYPKQQWRYEDGVWVQRTSVGLGRHRRIPPGSRIHHSALMRIKHTSYSPPNLSSAFLSRVRQVDPVPQWMSYTPD